MKTFVAWVALVLAGCAEYRTFNCFRCGHPMAYSRAGEAPCRQCDGMNLAGQCPACGNVEAQPGYGDLRCASCRRTYVATKCRVCNACYFSLSVRESCPLCGDAKGGSPSAELVNGARARLEKGDAEGALRDLAEAIAKNPAYRPAYLLRGRIRAERKEFGPASADYAKALELDPKDGDAQYRAACVEARRGENGKALDRLEQAVQAGFANWDLLRKDEDLAPLRSEARYRRLLEKAPN